MGKTLSLAICSLLIVGLLGLAAGCGKKGPPKLPPPKEKVSLKGEVEHNAGWPKIV